MLYDFYAILPFSVLMQPKLILEISKLLVYENLKNLQSIQF